VPSIKEKCCAACGAMVGDIYKADQLYPFPETGEDVCAICLRVAKRSGCKSFYALHWVGRRRINPRDYPDNNKP